MAANSIQDGDHGMGKVLVDAMVGLSLLGKYHSLVSNALFAILIMYW